MARSRNIGRPSVREIWISPAPTRSAPAPTIPVTGSFRPDPGPVPVGSTTPAPVEEPETRTFRSSLDIDEFLDEGQNRLNDMERRYRLSKLRNEDKDMRLISNLYKHRHTKTWAKPRLKALLNYYLGRDNEVTVLC